MNKIITIAFFGFIILSCQKKQNIIDFESELKWKSFKVVNSGIDEDMEFTDSIYRNYGFMLIENNYRIEKISDYSARLFVGDNSSIIKASDSAYSDFVVIGENISDTLHLKQNKTKNDLNLFQGTWVENSKLSYTIKDLSIEMNQNDSVNKESELSFDLTNRYLKFKLKHSENKLEYMWKIESIKKDSLFLSKSYKTDTGWSTIYNKILIKKR